MSRFLIVDDSRVIRQIIHDELEGAGHTVVGEAGTGRDAIALCRTARPDVVTMDITMDDMDGVEAIRTITKFAPDTKVIVVSALSDDQLHPQLAALGVTAYIQKPFTVDKFIEQLNRLL
ncbi:MAG TPA: response regulator [Spirochaetia bacterium]|nr:response regulator [Spirochaetia bacterium]